MRRLSWFLALALALPTAAFSAEPQSIRVLEVNGQVRFLRPGSQEWNKLDPQTVLPEGARVETSPGASCELGFDGENRGTLRVKESSSVLLKGLSSSPDFSLDKGEVFAHVLKLKKDTRFQVRTPTSVATVRGTGWSQSSEQLDVFEGSVHVEGADGEEIDLFEGQSLLIDPSGDLGEVGPVSDESKSEWNDFSSSSAEQEAPPVEEQQNEEEEQNLLTEEPVIESPDEGFREDLLEAQAEQQEAVQEEEAEEEEDASDHDGGYTGGGGTIQGGGG